MVGVEYSARLFFPARFSPFHSSYGVRDETRLPMLLRLGQNQTEGKGALTGESEFGRENGLDVIFLQ